MKALASKMVQNSMSLITSKKVREEILKETGVEVSRTRIRTMLKKELGFRYNKVQVRGKNSI